MTKEELEKATGQELIEERNYCGVDGYYGDYLDDVNAEMLKRFNRLAELEEEKQELKDYCDKYTKTILSLRKNVAELEAQIEKMKWHKLNWDKAEENPDVDKLVRIRTRSGAEYICETYSYFPLEDEIGYGSVITQFSELNGDWVDDNEIEYWCEIPTFDKE
jgi:predicted nuclease with TOPRIM domain